MSRETKSDLKLKAVRDIPESVLDAMRRVIPKQASNGNLISAFVYIFTNGDCKIPPKAMELVESYTLFNKNEEILNKLINIEKLLIENNKQE